MRSRIEDMVNQQYGRLTVIGIDENRKCICKCECGTIKHIYPSNIKEGKTQSCGCLGMQNLLKRKHNLNGQRFGKLTVLEETEERKEGCVVWKCQCDCGNVYFVNSRSLIRGDVKSCGCLLNNKSNIQGQRFGKLVAKSSFRKKGRRKWLCQCDCGNEIIVDGANLKNGHTKSCGCLKTREQLKIVEGTNISLISSSKLNKNNKSGVKGVSFNKKTGKWVARLTFKKHIYCLGEFKRIEDAIKARREKEKIYREFIDSYNKQKMIEEQNKLF